jgi:hypothetical protein
VHLSVVREDPIQHLKGQVPSTALSLDLFKEPHPLDVVKKVTQSMVPREFRKELFPIVAERGMANIMAKRDGLDQVFIQSEKAADGPGDFGNELDVKDSMGDMVILDEIEYLCFVDVSGIGKGMEDPVRVE